MLVGLDYEGVGAAAECLLPGEKRKSGEGAVFGGAATELRILFDDTLQLKCFRQTAQGDCRVGGVHHGGGADLDDAKFLHLCFPG